MTGPTDSEVQIIQECSSSQDRYYLALPTEKLDIFRIRKLNCT